MCFLKSREIVSEFERTETSWGLTCKCYSANFIGVAGDEELILYLISIFLQRKYKQSWAMRASS